MLGYVECVLLDAHEHVGVRAGVAQTVLHAERSGVLWLKMASERCTVVVYGDRVECVAMELCLDL